MCKIKNLKPPCTYSVDGIAAIYLLDFDDFDGYRFDGNDLYANCLVTDILRLADFIQLEAPDMIANHNTTGNYSHVLKSFITTIDANTLANLTLGVKRRQLVVFRGNNSRYYTFGYEAGAVLTYTNQTADGFGHEVTLTCPSRYPLFEVTAEAMARFVTAYKFKPDFENGAFCEII